VGNSPAGRIVGRSRAAQTARRTGLGIFTAGASGDKERRRAIMVMLFGGIGQEIPRFSG
jgi:hypothetical protein